MEESSKIDIPNNDAENIDWSDFEQALGAYTEKLKNTNWKPLNQLRDVDQHFFNDFGH